MIALALFILLAGGGYILFHVFGPIGVVILILGVALLSTYLRYRNAHQRLAAIPTFEDYLAQHADVKTPEGVKCKACQSTRIDILPWDDAGNKIHVCGTCNTVLYKSVLHV